MGYGKSMVNKSADAVAHVVLSHLLWLYSIVLPLN